MDRETMIQTEKELLFCEKLQEKDDNNYNAKDILINLIKEIK